jgi:NADPH:quinone reductase-like Zn-dependent oxidoreductase
VVEVGDDVANFKAGDEVWSRLPEIARGTIGFDVPRAPDIDLSSGSWAEYIRCPEDHLARKPGNLSFEDAASLPLAALTSIQALRRYKGSLAGKTVFILAGCTL